MAHRIEYILVDDLDGSRAEETVRFSLDGVNYEMELSKENATQLRETVAPFVTAARRSGGRRTRGTGAAKGPNAAEIRAWALENGMTVSPRGRVPVNVRAAYEKAHN